jgi:glycosyltransferase involved in cell wall biosynthesis
MINGDRSEKGTYRACKVICHLLNKHDSTPKEIKIVVLGAYYIKSYLKLTNNSNRFIFNNYVSANDLEALYKNAHLFLFPTLNEGFGYPPLEAMKYGTLCACSANSAVTEICGDVVLYFNPHDEIEMGIRILQSFDEGIRKEKTEKISARYQLIRQRQDRDLDLLIQEIITYTG